MIKSIQSMSKAILATMLLTALVTMSGTIWLSIQNPLANLLIEEVPATILLLLPLVLLLLLLLSIAYIYSLHKKIKNPVEDYEFDEKIGILHNPKDNLTYCLSCLHKGLKSPLKVQENGGICLNNECKGFYPNPDYKSVPTYRTIHRRRSSFFD